MANGKTPPTALHYGKNLRFFEVGIDVITLGNHAWDQRETATYIRAFRLTVELP